jgi:hypothetical protein
MPKFIYENDVANIEERAHIKLRPDTNRGVGFILPNHSVTWSLLQWSDIFMCAIETRRRDHSIKSHRHKYLFGQRCEYVQAAVRGS